MKGPEAHASAIVHPDARIGDVVNQVYELFLDLETRGVELAAAPSERGARLVLELPAGAGRPARTPVAG